MFNAANKFNQAIGGWIVTNTGTAATTKTTDINSVGMMSMFQSAQNFNQDLNGWTPTSCKKFETMFNGASRFDGNMFTSTQAATAMNNMFAGAASFTGKSMGDLTTTTVTTYASMFEGATTFDQDISKWSLNANVVATSASVVGGFVNMFKNAAAFNSPLFTIDTGTQGNVNDLTSMFEGATAFNQVITGWTTTVVVDYENMFKNAASFNQNIAGWTPPGAPTLTAMFEGATNFQQNLCLWNGQIGGAALTVDGMFSSTSCKVTQGLFTTAQTGAVTGADVCCDCDGVNTPVADFPACQ